MDALGACLADQLGLPPARRMLGVADHEPQPEEEYDIGGAAPACERPLPYVAHLGGGAGPVTGD